MRLRFFDLSKALRQCRQRHIQARGEKRKRRRFDDRARCLRLTEVGELPGDRRDALVKDIKGDAVGLRQNDGGLLGITKALVGETFAVFVDLEAALHDHRPADQDPMRMRDRTVPLISRHVFELRAELAAPQDSVAAIARVSEIRSVAHFRNVPGDEIGSAAITVARQYQGIAAERVARSVRPHDLDTADRVLCIRIKRADRRIDDQGDPTLVRRLTQSVDQFDA